MGVERDAVTVAVAMRLLGVSRRTVIDWVRAGLLEGYRLSPAARSQYRIYRDSIERFMAARRVVGR